ncbi:hypothetical protein CGK22_01715 [Vibrio parahaemolyticus]|nr:hypothetical protein CGK22_01715 [Vibrio parahaemolyticus]TOD41596.1 hypothetical protein CGJ65_07055 [Vibrio parahaemolyticus]TOK49151.1 hypothetical protein CGI18_05340 [Vibrio parahaemolyticus]
MWYTKLIINYRNINKDFNMLRFIQRRRIKKVIKLMSTRLMVGYGSREYFSVGQVKTSTSELSACQQKIALALYANPQDLDLENQPELQAIRSDVAHDFFAGVDYTAQDVLHLFGAGGWKGGRMKDGMSHHFGMHSRY